MLKYGFIIILILTSSLYADPVISIGAPFSFAAPGTQHQPGDIVPLEVTLGYGEESNTIGYGKWYTETGIYDLSEDPNLDEFLEYATNGIADDMLVTLSDYDPYPLIVSFPSGFEASFFGRHPYPDLSPFQITGIRINVLDIFDTTGGHKGITIRYESMGIPEPSMIIMISVSLLLLCKYKNRLEITNWNEF